MSSTSFSTPGVHLWTLPSNIDTSTPLRVDLKGAGGGDGTGSGHGGSGEHLVVDIDIGFLTPGVDQIQVTVGGRGRAHSVHTGGAGGVNGGGRGGNAPSGQGGDGGGGATDVRIAGTALTDRYAVAPGGGGAPGFANHDGGDGGTATGQDGAGAAGGHGGAPLAGGAGGTGSGAAGDGSPGTFGSGGAGNDGSSQAEGGGGGGGGWYGGGGGGGATSSGFGGPGGGGSDEALGTIITRVRGGGAGPNQDGSAVLSYNVAPNAPAVDAGHNFSVAKILPVPFTFSDPDAGDTLSAADVRWRVGAGAWTTITGATLTTLGTNRFKYDFAAGTFTSYVGQSIEVQVRTEDSESAVGPWSASVYFSAKAEPTAPTSVVSTPDPPGDEITSNTPLILVDYPQDTVAVDVRMVNDVAGSPGSTVLAEVSGAIVYTAGVHGAVLPSFAYVNATSYHAQARYQHDVDVWSDWTDSGVLTGNINAPLQPSAVVTAIPESASVRVEITNPGSDPFPPDHNDLYRTDLTLDDEVRIATGIAVNGNFTDWTPGFHRRYRYRIVAVTADDATSSSV